MLKKADHIEKIILGKSQRIFRKNKVKLTDKPGSVPIFQ